MNFGGFWCKEYKHEHLQTLNAFNTLIHVKYIQATLQSYQISG